MRQHVGPVKELTCLLTGWWERSDPNTPVTVETFDKKLDSAIGNSFGNSNNIINHMIISLGRFIDAVAAAAADAVAKLGRLLEMIVGLATVLTVF